MSVRRRAVAVTLAVVAVAALASCSSPPGYVGEVGTMVDTEGATTVFVHTCGYDIDEVAVASDDDTVATFVPDAPFSGAQSFTLGEPAPSGWDASSEVQDAAMTADPNATITVEVSQHDPGADEQFRGGEATMERLLDQQGRIVMGKPHKSGDQSLTDPPEWDDACSHEYDSPETTAADD